MTTGSSMQDKVVFITGANSGIGKFTALGLAAMGATLALTGRDEESLLLASDWIRTQTGNDALHTFVADLSLPAQVRRLADEFKEKFDRLDVLINNAGLILGNRQATQDGLEMTFAVNHLAPFILTNQLLDLLKKSAPSRIVNVASAAHMSAKGMDFNDLQSEKRYRAMEVYSRTKLANILFTRELARLLKDTGVTANCLHPGVIRTGFGAHGDLSGIFSVIFSLVRPFLTSPEKGAQTSIYLASSPDVADVSGKYFAKSKQIAPSLAALDDEAAQRLWQASEDIAGRI